VDTSLRHQLAQFRARPGNAATIIAPLAPCPLNRTGPIFIARDGAISSIARRKGNGYAGHPKFYFVLAALLGALSPAMALDNYAIACNETVDPCGGQELFYAAPLTPQTARTPGYRDRSTTTAAANARAHFLTATS
jgi:hypothetical protein